MRRFKISRIPAHAALTGLLFSAIATGEPSNFRVGVGLFQADMQNAPAYLPDGSQNGISLFGEFPQSAHAASRFMLYRINGEDGVKLSGGETQLMWGFNLNDEGFRAYTGPAWHYENIRVPASSGGTRFRTFNGWGWQLGVGAQFRAVTLDLAATLRDPQDYNDENARAGQPDGDVWTYSLLTSYRF
ncbi:hypothetical protein ACQUQU_08355 [Thalassolituus sp. LLYu03]|uniref:hypothetical protein n=1 Tax=Thalassolituus sp. LLYu03 TaxID=3421656 RepID=UPI003D27A97E